MRSNPRAAALIEARHACEPFDGQEEELWAMRDYFWMSGSGVFEHAGNTWRSFLAGYREYGKAAALECGGRRRVSQKS